MNAKYIHFCWFGGKPLSKLTKKCIESWKKYLPDYEIIKWDETNVDFNECPFVKEAYENKKRLVPLRGKPSEIPPLSQCHREKGHSGGNHF